jgi:hypothetical protein
MSLVGVRRDKAALSSGCKPHPAPLQPEATGAVSTPRRENTRTSRVGLGAERVVGLAQVGVDASHRRLDPVFFGIEPGTKVCDGVVVWGCPPDCLRALSTTKDAQSDYADADEGEGGWLRNRCIHPSDGGPRVRIHLPPAASPARTRVFGANPIDGGQRMISP